MNPYLDDGDQRLYHGDCATIMPRLGSVDAVVTDPPYGLEFMGKEWDSFGRERDYASRTADGYGDKGVLPGYGRGGTSEDRDRFKRKANNEFQAWCKSWAVIALDVLKPGGHIVAFGGTRTYHRLACALEDAGFEIRDCLTWLYGSGFPKSLNIGDGRGTALKPAWEPIILARKPLTGTVAANVSEHGTGALNIDACRIGASEGDYQHPGNTEQTSSCEVYGFKDYDNLWAQSPPHAQGRWPANVVLDESAAELLDRHSGEQRDGVAGGNRGFQRNGYVGGEAPDSDLPCMGYGGGGGASRFFYTAKASRSERNNGIHDLPLKDGRTLEGGHIVSDGRTADKRGGPSMNHHPTVKPVALMRWLVRLTTPPGGLVLDPFVGSGSTLVACRAEGVQGIGIDRELDYLRIAEGRLSQLSLLADG